MKNIEQSTNFGKTGIYSSIDLFIANQYKSELKQSMARLDILKYPDPQLRIMAKPVSEVNDRIRIIVADMLETMYANNGIGLAATQVNIHLRIVVMDLSEQQNSPLVLINPDYEPIGHELANLQEGCLSIPGYYEQLERFHQVKLSALDQEGKEYTKNLEGIAAVCVQHELDHLEGKLFIDSLSRLKKNRIRKKIEKSKKKEAH